MQIVLKKLFAAVSTEMFDIGVTLTLTPRPSKPNQITCRLNYIIKQNLVKFRLLGSKIPC